MCASEHMHRRAGMQLHIQTRPWGHTVGGFGLGEESARTSTHAPLAPKIATPQLLTHHSLSVRRNWKCYLSQTHWGASPTNQLTSSAALQSARWLSWECLTLQTAGCVEGDLEQESIPKIHNNHYLFLKQLQHDWTSQGG